MKKVPKGATTRDRILDVAERHFADFGYDGTSQRAIQREVHVNVSTANYYFGSKEALYAAVIERHLPKVIERRSAIWDAIPAGLVGQPRLEAMLAAYLRPHIEVAATPEGRYYGRLIARITSDRPGIAPNVFLPKIAPFRQTFFNEVKLLFPKTSEARIEQAFEYSLTLMFNAPYDADLRLLPNLKTSSLSPEDWIETMVTFAIGGFIALCGPPAMTRGVPAKT